MIKIELEKQFELMQKEIARLKKKIKAIENDVYFLTQERELRLLKNS